jgi:hypothetical protein
VLIIFLLTKYQSRWYNKRTYAVHNPQHPHYNHNTNWGQDILTEMEDVDSNHEEDHDNDENPFDGISSNMVVDKDNEEPLKVTYPELLDLCTILIRTVANDKKEKTEVHSIVQGLIAQYQKDAVHLLFNLMIIFLSAVR